MEVFGWFFSIAVLVVTSFLSIYVGVRQARKFAHVVGQLLVFLGTSLAVWIVGVLVALTPFYFGLVTIGHGRPIRLRPSARRANVEERDDWIAGPVPSAGEVRDHTRTYLADAWLQAASTEHASVATFAQLSLQLMALGAGPDLVRACHEAALDEIDHARRCYALAGVYGAKAWGPGHFAALRGVRPGRATLPAIARESLRDGCLMEGFSAAYLGEAAQRAADPALRATLSAMAQDEARHASLAWNILAWSLHVGGVAVRRTVRDALAGLPETLRSRARAPAGLDVHGILSKDLHAEIYGSTLQAVRGRARELLASLDEAIRF